MAIFFKDKHLSCPKCNNTVLQRIEQYRYSYTTEKNKLLEEPYGYALYCSKCNTLVKEHIMHETHAPTIIEL